MPKTLATLGSPTPSRSSIALPWCGSFNRCLGGIEGCRWCIYSTQPGYRLYSKPVLDWMLLLQSMGVSCQCHAVARCFWMGWRFQMVSDSGILLIFYPVPHISLPLCKEGSLPRWCFGRLATSCATSTRSWIPCWVCRCALTSKAVRSTAIDSWTQRS